MQRGAGREGERVAVVQRLAERGGRAPRPPRGRRRSTRGRRRSGGSGSAWPACRSGRPRCRRTRPGRTPAGPWRRTSRGRRSSPASGSSPSASGTGEASSCMTWPWNGLLVGVGHPADAALRHDLGLVAGVDLRLGPGVDVPQPDGVHRLRLVVEVAAEGARAGRRRPTAAAECAGRRPRRRRTGPRPRARARPAGRALATPVARPSVTTTPVTSASGTRVWFGLAAGGLAEDDVGARPGHPAVLVPDHGQRHRRDPAVLVPAVVEGGGSAACGPRRRTGRRRRRARRRSSSRSPSASSSSRSARKSIRSLPPGRGQAPVQCAPIPPTLLDMAAAGRPSSPGCW